MYLGDGCLSVTRGIWRLHVVLDARYPAIIAELRSRHGAGSPGQTSTRDASPRRELRTGLDVVDALALPLPSTWAWTKASADD
jgi:hypothetical protein